MKAKTALPWAIAFVAVAAVVAASMKNVKLT